MDYGRNSDRREITYGYERLADDLLNGWRWIMVETAIDER